MRTCANNMIGGLLGTILCGTLVGAAATPPSLTESFKQHYSPTRIVNGDVLRAGSKSKVIVQRPGILRVVDADSSFLDVCPSVYRAGEVHSTAGSFCDDLARRSQRTLSVSDHAYVTSIYVNSVADQVSFYLAVCESCPPGKSVSVSRSLLILEFPKGYLAKADTEDVIKASEQVLTAENPGETAESKLVKQQAQASAPANQPEPSIKSIQLGQTPEQIIAILGNPEVTINLNARTVYVYRHFKIVFVGGKLSEVQ